MNRIRLIQSKHLTVHPWRWIDQKQRFTACWDAVIRAISLQCSITGTFYHLASSSERPLRSKVNADANVRLVGRIVSHFAGPVDTDHGPSPPISCGVSNCAPEKRELLLLKSQLTQPQAPTKKTKKNTASICAQANAKPATSFSGVQAAPRTQHFPSGD